MAVSINLSIGTGSVSDLNAHSAAPFVCEELCVNFTSQDSLYNTNPQRRRRDKCERPVKSRILIDDLPQGAINSDSAPQASGVSVPCFRLLGLPAELTF